MNEVVLEFNVYTTASFSIDVHSTLEIIPSDRAMYGVKVGDIARQI